MAAYQSSAGTIPEALGQSERFLDFQERLSRVAPIDRPVLIIGERGSGKELAAARLHYLSGRWQKPFVTLNCASLAPTLVETELFGHERGAFTGALQKRTGRFEAADTGTLFLDEIGLIPIEVQEKILRVVEYGSFERVGGSGVIEVDVRIVSATNADLPRMAEAGSFKRDLLDRLSFDVLFVPPLRMRSGDILLLANHFAGRMAFELGHSQLPAFTKKAEELLKAYPWRGNVRELKNVVERAVYRADNPAMIADIQFDPFQPPWTEEPEPSDRRVPAGSDSGLEARGQSQSGSIEDGLLKLPFKDSVEQLKRILVKNAMVHSRYNQKQAAASLGLSYDQFRGLYRKFMVDR